MNSSSQSHFLPLLLLIILGSPCSFSFSYNPKYPPVLDHHHHQKTYNGHNLLRAYPKILRTSRRELITASASAKVVYNVNDFGAKANGGDDTKVCPSSSFEIKKVFSLIYYE